MKRRVSFFRVFRDNLITRGYVTAFLLSSTAVVACTIPLLTSGVSPQMPAWLRIAYTLFGMLAAIGACLIWLGMWAYWVRFDSSGIWTKRLWLIVLLFGFWFGSILYFAVVYIPQVLPRIRSQTRPEDWRERYPEPATTKGLGFLIGAWVLFLAVGLLFPAFPRLATSLHLGTFLQVYGLVLMLCSLAVGLAWLYRSGIRRSRVDW